MSLRKNPYLPLYTKDFLTDEKLNECSAESTGVYIRIMCIMHNSDPYGKILLRQKYRQTARQNERQIVRQVSNFAEMLSRQMPYSTEVIERSLLELLEEDVLTLEGDVLLQKRMVRDEEISAKRASAGKKGAEATNSKGNFADTFADEFAAAKTPANSEIEIENINNKKREGNKRKNSGSSNAREDVFETYAGNDTELLKALRDFEEFRKKAKKPMTDQAKRLAVKKLDQLSEGVRDKSRYKRECLEESILRGWQGLFELKDFQDSPEPPPSAEIKPDTPVSFGPGGKWEDLVP